MQSSQLSESRSNENPPAVAGAGRQLVLAGAFLGWMFAGVQMGIMPLVARAVSQDLIGAQFNERIAGQWFAWYTVAFLLGAAIGGMLLGWMGDRRGRTRAMGWSIVCYSVFCGAGYFVKSQEQLIVLRFLSSLGVGGMWPNGVSLISEFWPDVSRPMLAGLMGAAANIGVLLTGLIGSALDVTPTSWRWIMLVGAAPGLLGVVALTIVPESPQWLAAGVSSPSGRRETPVLEVFRPPLLRVTLVGICLGTVPLLGGWGSGKFLIPWADALSGTSNPGYKAATQIIWAAGAALGAFFGGRLAHALGRRFSYFLTSLVSLVVNGGIFRFVNPLQSLFLPSVFVLGFVSTIFFGWLPLYLPELFPTRVRATGTGVAYNFGRFASAAGVLGAGALVNLFDGDYAKVGAVTSLIYAVGMVVIWWAPDTTGQNLRRQQQNL